MHINPLNENMCAFTCIQIHPNSKETVTGRGPQPYRGILWGDVETDFEAAMKAAWNIFKEMPARSQAVTDADGYPAPCCKIVPAVHTYHSYFTFSTSQTQ